MAYNTAFKIPIGMPSFRLVYGKNCNLPVKMEQKAFSAIKYLNFDLKKAGEKRLLQMEELDAFRFEANENARLFKERIKRWHEKHILHREFTPGLYLTLV